MAALHNFYSNQSTTIPSPQPMDSLLHSGIGQQVSPMDSSGYLPGFLLGSPSFKPQQQQQIKQQRYFQPQQSPITIGNTQSPYQNSERKKEIKPGGPPVESLNDLTSGPLTSSSSIRPMSIASPHSPERKQLSFSSLQSTRNSIRPSNTPIMPHSQTPHMSTAMSSMTQGTHMATLSPAQIDPFYSQGEELKLLNSDDILDSHWVTVFGFPPNATSYIIEQFSQYGTIIRHEMTSEGNWVHLQYQTKLQARKALSKNGKVYGEGVMVGVQPCIAKAVIDKYPSPPLNISSGHLGTPKGKPSTMRPLTAAYHASSSNYSVAPINPNTPQKSTGFMSRAMEYIFGW